MSDDAAEEMKARDEYAMIQAKSHLDSAVETYASVLQAGGQPEIEGAKIQLHRAVVGFWWRLQPVLIDEGADSWGSVEDLDDWDQDVIWSGPHPRTGHRVTIEGLSDVGDWLDRSTTQRVELSGPKYGGATEMERIQLYLPGPAAVRCAQLLTREFRECGWGASVTTTARTEIDDDLMEEVHDWFDENVRGQA